MTTLSAAGRRHVTLRSARASLRYRTVSIDGLDIFYREAGDPEAPVILLLHGFPTSSRQFEPLMPLLADRYRLIAPDFVGFGHSACPPPDQFDYTYQNQAELLARFIDALGLSHYIPYYHDYGGQIGLRLAERHQDRIPAVIIQNSPLYDEALTPVWDKRKAYWADPGAGVEGLKQALLSPEATRDRHVGRSPHPERYDPDLWGDEIAFLSRPGSLDIQIALFSDYPDNIRAWPSWRAWLKRRQPPLLVTWGKYDASFWPSGAIKLLDDHPVAEIHLLDAGHFAIDEACEQIAWLIGEFLARRL